VLFAVLQGIGVILPLLIAIAYLTLVERKVIGAIQSRKGPNIVGFFGLLQPIADALKLLVKETILPSGSNKILFLFGPLITMFLSLVGWAVVPFCKKGLLVDMSIGVLYIFAVSSLGIYGIIIAGWSSDSRYAFLGALRSAAQMISYEVSIGIISMHVLLCVGALNFCKIVEYNLGTFVICLLFFSCALFFISLLAETNRSPFDLPESEAELVAGYFVEYASMSFALFFLGEYGNMILACVFITQMFVGYITPVVLGFIGSFFLFIFIWVRASLPRYRYDQLMMLGWKIILPISLGLLVVVAGIKFLTYPSFLKVC